MNYMHLRNNPALLLFTLNDISLTFLLYLQHSESYLGTVALHPLLTIKMKTNIMQQEFSESMHFQMVD